MATIKDGTVIWGPSQYITSDDGTNTFTITPYVKINTVSESGTNASINYSWYIHGGTKNDTGYSISLYTNANDFTISPGNGKSAAISTASSTDIKIATATFTVAQGADLKNTTFKCTWTGGGSSAGEGQAWASKFATPNGFTGSGYSAPVYYTAPTKFTITVTGSTTTSITVKASWTEGSETSTAKITINGTEKTISSNGGSTTISGLTPNKSYSISGSLTDGTTTLSASSSTWTHIATPTLSLSSTTTTITASGGANGNAAASYQYKLDNGSWTTSNSFTVTPNTQYTVYVKIVNSSNTVDTESDTSSASIWSHPVINTPSVSLKSGSEHNTIQVSVSPQVESSYDQFAYSINDGAWSSWTTNKSHEFTGLAGNTSYKISVKMRNTSSGFESESKSDNITTWHNPLTNLVVNLTNSWFWYLVINCGYTYTGTISKYEFAIGDDQSFVTTASNSHSRGSTDSNSSSKLNYNTSYNCKVRLTDNHGRTYTANNSFKTLDERPLYINGSLREVKLINSNGVSIITPNLLTVVKPDGSTVNMNKIINNDSRIQFS